MGQFGIGQSVHRKEDDRFITGKGQYQDDINLANQAFAVFHRSPHANARILSIDVGAAKSMPGVLAIYTGADIEKAGLPPIACILPLKNRDGSGYNVPPRPLLATHQVRHVGDGIAMVVAETLAQARDASDAILVDYETLDAVIDPVFAATDSAPKVYDGLSNVALDWVLGNEKATDEAFAKAAKVVSIDLNINRIVVASIEARGVLAEYDATEDRYTVYVGTQGVFAAKRMIAHHMGVSPDKVRVITGDVGGSFGMKGFDFPENSLVPFAARQLGRPVKWTSDRQEAFLSDTQGREAKAHAELALDANNHFTGIRVLSHANVGAYLSVYSLFIPTVAGFRLTTGAYRIPAAFVNVKCTLTNTVWIDAFRGAGRPECAYILERLVDKAGVETGLGPIEIRRRNFVTPADMPYDNGMMAVYDSGDFDATFNAALAQADWAGTAARRAEANKRGKLYGAGLSYYMEVTAAGPQEGADIKFKPDGRVHMGIGAGPSGQGHETAFAQILEDRLGVPFDKIDFVWGDSDQLTMGSGTGGAKTLMLAGTALFDVAEKIIDKGKKLAGHVLEAAVEDIEFADGTFTIAGTDRRINIMDLAAKARTLSDLPDDVPASLDDIGKSTSSASTYPNGSHIAEVEVDPETGTVKITRYSVIDDFGMVVNPMIVKGQAHGGIAQSIGQALMEDGVFDPETGQLLSGSFSDYAMPHADHFPRFIQDFNNVPCKGNVMGVKGAGEAGSVGCLPTIMNAVQDALRQAGVAHFDMPATPLRVWQALEAAKRKGAA